MDKFDHYLITRFNVPVPTWDRDKAGVSTLDDAWMNHRMTLFNQFCAPSVAGQTNLDFKWLIYCDTKTKPDFMDDLRRSIAMIPHAEIRFVIDFDALKADLKQVISFSTHSFVILSRVDNDDALGRKYIELVQSNFVAEDRTVINLCGGALYDLHQFVLTKLPNMHLNHFGSLIERRKDNGDYLTVMGFAHHNPPGDVKIIEVKCQLAWMKIIHNRNLNSKTFGRPVLSANLNQYFSLSEKTMPISLINSLLYFFKRGGAVLKRKWRLN